MISDEYWLVMSTDKWWVLISDEYWLVMSTD